MRVLLVGAGAVGSSIVRIAARRKFFELLRDHRCDVLLNGKDGAPREVYLYQVADNQATMRDWGAQAVVWQTAVNPVAALELLEDGAWSGAGVLGPEAFDARPFLGLLPDYGAPWGLREQPPAARQGS
jgi:saccharopine dehydrogenase-like NADP-dependent oxidoreductase